MVFNYWYNRILPVLPGLDFLYNIIKLALGICGLSPWRLLTSSDNEGSDSVASNLPSGCVWNSSHVVGSVLSECLWLRTTMQVVYNYNNSTRLPGNTPDTCARMGAGDWICKVFKRVWVVFRPPGNTRAPCMTNVVFTSDFIVTIWYTAIFMCSWAFILLWTWTSWFYLSDNQRFVWSYERLAVRNMNPVSLSVR